MREHGIDRRLGVQRQPGTDAASADRRERPGNVVRRLDMDRQVGRSGIGVAIHPLLGPFDHQVDVEGQPGRPMEIRHHLRPECEVRDEMAIHDVDVDPVRAGSLDRDDGVAAICKSYGVDARRVDVPYGRAVEPDLVRDELAKEKGKDAAKAVLITHNETSTGVLNPIKDIAAVVRDSGKLFLVDSVSGAGCADLEIDDWGIDVCITASQKAWGAPPGVAMVTMSPRAWKAYEKSNLPKAYF